MKTKAKFDKIYARSEDVVSREIQGELVIIPVTSGIGDLEDDIFTLNETGKIIWNKLDGKRNLKDIKKELSQEFQGPADEIERDVLGLMEELLKRRLVVESK